MIPILTPDDYVDAIDPDVPHWYEEGKNRIEAVYDKVFQVERSDQAWERVASHVGIGFLQEKATGEPAKADKLAQGPSKTFKHTRYSIVLGIDEDLVEDANFGFAERTIKAIGDASRRTREAVCAQHINEGFFGGKTGPDGVSLFSDNHKFKGGTFSNKINGDLNLASLETGYRQLADIPDAAGNIAPVNFRALVMNRYNHMNAIRLLDTVKLPGSSMNDVNPVNKMGLVPNGIIRWDYMTSDKAFVLLTDEMNEGLMMRVKRDLQLSNDGDFSTGAVFYKGSERYMVYHGNARAALGSPGL